MFEIEYSTFVEYRIMQDLSIIEQYEQIDHIEDSMKLVNGEY